MSRLSGVGFSVCAKVFVGVWIRIAVTKSEAMTIGISPEIVPNFRTTSAEFDPPNASEKLFRMISEEGSVGVSCRSCQRNHDPRNHTKYHEEARVRVVS